MYFNDKEIFQQVLFSKTELYIYLSINRYINNTMEEFNKYNQCCESVKNIIDIKDINYILLNPTSDAFKRNLEVNYKNILTDNLKSCSNFDKYYFINFFKENSFDITINPPFFVRDEHSFIYFTQDCEVKKDTAKRFKRHLYDDKDYAILILKPRSQEAINFAKGICDLMFSILGKEMIDKNL